MPGTFRITMLDKLFRKHPKTDELAKAAQAPAQRPDVPYDPGLIVALTYQHRAMVIQLDEARNAAQDGAYDEVKGAAGAIQSRSGEPHEAGEHPALPLPRGPSQG